TEQSSLQQIEQLGEILASAAGPLAIVIDDAQWVDETTALALRMLVPQLAASPVLWLVTRRRPRPTESGIEDAVDWLVRESWAQEHAVGPLDQPSVLTLCRHVLHASPDATVLDLAERANGNPLLLEVTLTTLLKGRQIVLADEVATVVG